MPNILFASESLLFADDLREQIALYAKDFNLLENDNADLSPDIIIVDEDVEKLEQLHSQYIKTPSFLLTSQTDELINKSVHAHLITKPFSLNSFFDELRSCINLFENSSNGYLVFNQYIVRPIKKDIYNQRSGEITKLTEKEVAILKYLYKAQDKIVTKNELLQEVWGYNPEVSTHTVETHVYRLRQKVEHENADAQLIITLDGGYQLKI